MKKNLELYYIDDNYINFLKNSGHKSVENNYANEKNQKPYVGVVLEINNHKYFAPLSSPKDKYSKMSDNNPTVFKISKNNGKLIGVIRINNMIPVSETSLTKLDFNLVKDNNYKHLIYNQYRIIQANTYKIQTKAQTMYNLVVNKRNYFYCNLSNDFNKLELDCGSYIQNKNNYQIDFSFNKEQTDKLGKKTYNVLINDINAKDLLLKDPNIEKVLDGLANHKDIKDKGISAESLKSGFIQPNKLSYEVIVSRPESRIVDRLGNKIEPKKIDNKKTIDFEL